MQRIRSLKNRKRQWRKLGQLLIWSVIGILGMYILCHGIKRQSVSGLFYACARLGVNLEGELSKAAERSLYPGLAFAAGGGEASSDWEEFLLRRAVEIFPLYPFLDGQEIYQTEIESLATYDMLIRGGLHDENEIDIKTGEAFELAEQEKMAGVFGEEDASQEMAFQENSQEAVSRAEYAGTLYTLEQLADFEFLKNSFYVVENNTDISADLLRAETLLGMDMTIKQDPSKPQILIYHTHSQEGFVDSVPGDNGTTIVGVGEYLAELLRKEYGYQVIHNTNVYDFREGKLDRNQAYALAEAEVTQILAENPSIEVVIDLHRDGVQEGTHLVTEVNGKATAQFMFFNGLSYSKRNGSISYLPNPYIGENLGLTLKLKLACEKYFPGVSRKIYLKSLRYNLHLSPKALLVEAGAQTNTLEEVKNAMEPLAFVLNQVLQGRE